MYAYASECDFLEWFAFFDSPRMQNKTATDPTSLAIGLYSGTAAAILFVLLAMTSILMAKYYGYLTHKCRDCCLSSRQRELEA